MSSLSDDFGFVPLNKTDESSNLGFIPLGSSQKDESNKPEIGRHIARTGSRIAEQVLGLPGDVYSFIESLKSSGSSLPELLGFKPNKEAPTSSSLKKFSEETTGGFTSPKNEFESLADEFTEDVVNLIGPGKVKKAFLLAGSGNAIKQGLKAAGFETEAQNIGKVTGLFGLSMINPRGIQNLYEGLYDKVRKSAPTTSLKVPQLEQRLATIEGKLQKGLTEPTKNAVLKPVQELKSKIKNGEIPADELISARFDLNKLMGDPEVLKYGKNQFPLVVRAVNKAIKSSPELSKDLKSSLITADEAYGALQQSKKAANFIKKKLPHGLKSSGIGIILEAAYLPEAIAPTIGAAAAGYGGLKAYELSQRIFANPTMRKYYSGMLSGALQENKTIALRNLMKLDDELYKEENQL